MKLNHSLNVDLMRIQVEDHYCTLDEYIALTDKSHFWDRLKSHFYSTIILSDRNRIARHLLRSTQSRYAEKQRQFDSKYWYIIHPYSTFRLAWAIFMTLVWLTTLWFIPYVHAFDIVGIGEQADIATRQQDYTMLLAMDCLCIVDIVVNFFTGYFDRSTREMVIDQKLIFRKYFLGYLFIDLISSNPYFNAIQARAEVNVETHSFINIGFVLMDSVKLLRLPAIIANISYIFKSMNLGHVFYRMVVIFVIFWLCLHWMTCFSYILPFLVHGKPLTDKHHEEYYTKFSSCWVNIFMLPGQYRYAKYRFSMLRVVAHFTNIGVCGKASTFMLEDVASRATIVMVGYLFHAYLFGYILHWSMLRAYSETKYYEMMNQLDQFMFHKQMSRELQKRMHRYYEFRFQNNYYREHNILHSLSDPIRREVALVCCRRLVENVAIFKDLPRAAIASIVMVLKCEVFLEDDFIITSGTTGTCMYFLSSGSVAVLLSTGKEICHLSDGAHFGEVSLMHDNEKRIASVLALETCECYRLERKDFKRILHDYPGLKYSISRLAWKRQKEATKIDQRYRIVKVENRDDRKED